MMFPGMGQTTEAAGKSETLSHGLCTQEDSVPKGLRLKFCIGSGCVVKHSCSAVPDLSCMLLSMSLDHSMTHFLKQVLMGFLTGKIRMMSQVPPKIHIYMLLRGISFLSQVVCVPRNNLAVLRRVGLPWAGISSAFQARQRGPAAALGSICSHLHFSSLQRKLVVDDKAFKTYTNSMCLFSRHVFQISRTRGQ